LWNEFAVCGVLGPSVALARGLTGTAVIRKVPTDKADVHRRWPDFNLGGRRSVSVLALLHLRGHLRSSDLQAYLRFETIPIIAGYGQPGADAAALQGVASPLTVVNLSARFGDIPARSNANDRQRSARWRSTPCLTEPFLRGALARATSKSEADGRGVRWSVRK